LGGLVEKPLPGGNGRALMVPDDWAEYGLGADHRWVDHPAYSLQTRFWVTNGLQGMRRVADQSVDFTSSSGDSRDNNLDKAFGLRIVNQFAHAFNVGISGYTCAWAADREADPTFAESVLESDRMYLGNVDCQVGYNAVRIPVLRDIRLRAEYALMRTMASADSLGNGAVPWHTKTAGMVEVTWRTPVRWLEARWRCGHYDDNTIVRNSRDLFNHNVSLDVNIREAVHVIGTYFWNREAVNESRDDYLLLKVAFQL
jgi:hypothetical protein